MKDILTYVLEVLSEPPYSEERFMDLHYKMNKSSAELVEYDRLTIEREWENNIQRDKEAEKLIQQYIGDLQQANIKELDIFMGVLLGTIATHMIANNPPEKAKRFIILLTKSVVKMKNRMREQKS